MPENLPFVSLLFFIFTTLLTVFLFYRASGSARAMYIILGWLFLQSLVSVTGFYTNMMGIPPRFLLLILPPLVLIVVMFYTRWGKAFMDSLDYRKLTYLHTVRVLVELMLYFLYERQMVPELMTFEGRNFDVLSGLTAPFVAYFGYMREQLPKWAILAWNFIGLALLLNIVINAVLSAPTSFQAFGFDQPNRAVGYFPFVWLPCGIVPLVLFSHLASIRELLKKP